ncbi:MAG: class I SAM-dependent methyltransferase [Chloroflexota bacterium]
MPTEKEVYEAHADQYERLIQCEDYQGNILREIEKVIALDDMDVVELGAGTGRLTRLLAPRVRSIKAFDASAHMLEVAEKSLRAMGSSNWATGVADHRRVPVGDSSADLVISGWSFCYLAVWGGSNWQLDLQAGLDEADRILRPGGMVILLETLGTGSETPTPPGHLGGYYAWLTEAGFERGWMRTDYRFESIEEAVELSTFFFGETMGQAVREKQRVILPECTGIWRRKRV